MEHGRYYLYLLNKSLNSVVQLLRVLYDGLKLRVMCLILALRIWYVYFCFFFYYCFEHDMYVYNCCNVVGYV